MTEWVALCPILEVCDREICYKRGERHWEPLLRETSARNHLSATLKDTLAVAREWRWKSSRRGRGRRDRDAEESENGFSK